MRYFNDKKLKIKSAVIIMVIVAVFILMLLNIISTSLANRYGLAIDLTSNHMFGLEQETVDNISGINEQVTVQVLATKETFVNTTTYNAQASEIMDAFSRSSNYITTEYLDYVHNPGFATNYPELSIKHGDVLVSSNDKYKLVKTEQLFNYVTNKSGQLSIASSKAEDVILQAILYVTDNDITNVSVVNGHNEADSSALYGLLRDNNFDVDEIRLATEDLTSDTDILLLLAPKADLDENELKKLDNYLKNEGAYGKLLFYCADVEQPELPNLESFLSEWGVSVDEGAIFETDETRVYNYQPFYPIVDYVDDNTANLLRSTEVPMLMQLSRPLTVDFKYNGNYSTHILAEFGETSGVRPNDASDDFSAEDAERKGPIASLVRCDYTLRNKENASKVSGRSSVIISGSVAFLDDYALGTTAFSNSEYLIALFNSLCDRDNPVYIQPKSIEGNALNINQAEANRLGVLFIIIIPCLMIVLGVAIWLLRRHK